MVVSSVAVAVVVRGRAAVGVLKAVVQAVMRVGSVSQLHVVAVRAKAAQQNLLVLTRAVVRRVNQPLLSR
jgi:hypothetical protein